MSTAREATPTVEAPDRDGPGPNPRARLWRARLRAHAWWATFVLFGALTGTWALTAPLFSGPDEPAHVIKASGVVRGQFVGRAGPVPTIGVMRVPRGIASANDVPGCFAFKSNVSAACAPEIENSYSISRAPTPASLYPPLYYLLVGWPSLIAPSAIAVYLMRLVSAALCSALIASAVASAKSFRRPRPMLLAVAIATTPMVVFLSGVVNPSALEITSAICFWVSGLLLVSEPETRGSRRVVARTGIAGALLASTRFFSPLFLGLILLMIAASASRPVLKELVRSRRVRLWGGAVVTSALLTLVWAAVMGGAQQVGTQPPGEQGLGTILRGVLGRQDFNFRQMIGFFGWLDTPAPSLTYHLWGLLLGALLIMALVCARGRLKWVLITTALVTMTGPVLIESVYFPKQGYFWQGRYTMPLAVGVVILAGFAVARESGVADLFARANGAIGAAVSTAHMLAYLAFAQRFSVGREGPLNFLSGSHWSPPVPLPLLVVIALTSTIAFSRWLLDGVARAGEDAI